MNRPSLSLLAPLLLLLGCGPAPGAAPSTDLASAASAGAPPSSAAELSRPPARIGAPIAVRVSGAEYELGAGRSELVIDAGGWVALRGFTDRAGRTLDDVPAARVVGATVFGLDGGALARIDDEGVIVPLAFESLATIRVDDEGFLIGWHGHRLDAETTFAGEVRRRRDLALAAGTLHVLPWFSRPAAVP